MNKFLLLIRRQDVYKFRYHIPLRAYIFIVSFIIFATLDWKGFQSELLFVMAIYTQFCGRVLYYFIVSIIFGFFD